MPVQVRRKAWFERHWMLVVSLAVLLTLLAVSAFVLSLFYLIRSSDSATLAIATAEANPLLTRRLGQPLKVGWMVTGSIEVTPASGHAELAIPISGPKGRGTVYAEARKSAGLWHLELLQFGADGSDERLDLLPGEPDKPTGSP
jgi:hypothetical protein